MQHVAVVGGIAACSLNSRKRMARAYGELHLMAARRALTLSDYETASALVEEGLRLACGPFPLAVRDRLAELQSMIRLHTPVHHVIHGEVVLMSPGVVMGPELIFS